MEFKLKKILEGKRKSIEGSKTDEDKDRQSGRSQYPASHNVISIPISLQAPGRRGAAVVRYTIVQEEFYDEARSPFSLYSLGITPAVCLQAASSSSK